MRQVIVGVGPASVGMSETFASVSPKPRSR